MKQFTFRKWCGVGIRKVGFEEAVDKKQLMEQLRDIEARIEELERRIPPHSVQPHLIAQLDELEAERDRIVKRLDVFGNT